MRPIGATSALLAASLALAACGGGSKAKTTTRGGRRRRPVARRRPAPPTSPRPTPICTQTQTSLAGLRPATKALVALGDTPKAFAKAVPIFRRIHTLELSEVARLKALPLPAGNNAQAIAYLNDGDQAAALIGRIADGFASGNRPALLAAEKQGSKLGAVTKGLAQGYGFKVCGHGAGLSGI